MRERKRAAGSRGMIPPASGHPVEIVDDHRTVEQDLAGLEHERRNFAQRILRPQWIGGIEGVGSQKLDLGVDPEHGRGHPDLAHEG